MLMRHVKITAQVAAFLPEQQTEEGAAIAKRATR